MSMALSATAVNSRYTELDSGTVARGVLASLVKCLENEDSTGYELSPLAGTNYEESCKDETRSKVFELVVSSIKNARLKVGAKPLPTLSTISLDEPIGTADAVFQFARGILIAIDIEPVEYGSYHPLESILTNAIRDHKKETIIWLNRLVKSAEGNPYIAASIIKIVGRLELGICKDWGFDFIRLALAHKDIGVRYAAVKALESWDTNEATQLLKVHHDIVPWLQDYINRVIIDLECT